MSTHRNAKRSPHASGRHLPHGVTRRQILSTATAGLGLTLLGPLGRGLLREAAGAPTGQPFCVVVNLLGGNDGLNTVVPLTLQPYYDRRNLGQAGSIAIPPGTELALTGGPAPTADYGLHPAMSNLQQLWNEGDLALVTKVGYPTPNLSHFTSQDIYSYGVRGGFAPLGLDESGWIARFADLYAPTSLGAVSIGMGRPLDFVGGTSNPLQAADLATFRYDEDLSYPDGHLHRLEAAKAVLDGYATQGVDNDIADAMGQGLDLAEEIQSAVAAYQSDVDYGGANPPNIQKTMRDIAMLVQYGFETQIYYTGFGGFDTHANQGAGTGSHATLLARLDTALGAFAEDLKDMGVWDQAAVVVISEFGRRNYQNGSNGCDHGGASAFLAVGGAVAGGMYGDDLTEADLNAEYPLYEVDFRDLYKEVLNEQLAHDPAPVFPEIQPKNTQLGFIG